MNLNNVQSAITKTSKDSIQAAKSVLQEVFGYEHFRGAQLSIIEHVLAGHNTLAIMPTGGGKSLCYQIPAILFEGLTIVISPLISLMQDQVRQLKALDVSACVLNSAISNAEYQSNIDKIKHGQVSLLFVAPETIMQVSLLNVLKALNVSCIAIDEAHCISEWGHEFRPEYRQLNQLLEHFKQAVCIALTATATPRVRLDIKQQLMVDEGGEFIASFDRHNLFIEVTPKDKPYQQAKIFIQKHPEQSGIIYCQSRASVDELSAKLESDGFSVLPYHAGLTSAQRSNYQEQFVRDDVSIIVATIAFGMGINKPDVRFVLHYDLPKNIEGYYQQIGRAGRDGLPANCLLLFGYGDTGKIRFFIDQMNNEHERRLATMHLNQMLALAETEECRRIPLLQYFAEENLSDICKQCDNCVNEKKPKDDMTIPAQKFLSCVHRTGQLFGASHIVDVLRGSNAEKVLQHQHNMLSTYNIGNELSKKQWMVFARQLIQKGLLIQDEKYGSLKLTVKAREVLKGELKFYAQAQSATANVSKAKDTRLNINANSHPTLFEILRKTRKQIADESNLPPFTVFSDRTLQELSHYLPRDHASFLLIHGVGQSKLTKYGDIFMALIIQFCEDNNL